MHYIPSHMVYTQRGSIRPPPRYKKNRLGSGVKVEIPCLLSVWDLAQQTIGINLVALQHASRRADSTPRSIIERRVNGSRRSKSMPEIAVNPPTLEACWSATKLIPIVCCARSQTLSGQDISTFTPDPSRFFLYRGGTPDRTPLRIDHM